MSGGAYSGCSYDSNPNFMCIFSVSRDCVSTIAQEMGLSTPMEKLSAM